ncbi:MAG: hypothetical protein M1818_003869 [Claussenomyces sp. TS43310]|nr:MAG: hypothetical protein M1818_003869 [Claussenomyces sp. TS43310]
MRPFIGFMAPVVLLACVGKVVSLNVTEDCVEPGAATVNLGYTLHSATAGTASNGMQYLNFSNVRYAAAPTGTLRFAPPSSPLRTSGVEDGQKAVICSQAEPEWLDVDTEFLEGLPLTGGPTPNYTVPPVDPRASEDCLFLDVLVPTDTFKHRHAAKAAVLVYIHGGGFFKGWKSDYGDGLGLVTTSKANGGEGIVYVAINYRLGLFGWLAGSSFSKQGGTQNAGLLDQRFALEWVKKYIALFGGDPKRITVIGESAGAGSIMAHTVSKGGAPFSRGIAQSPYLVDITAEVQEATYNSILKSAKVKSLSALKTVTSAELQNINALVIGNGLPWAFLILGPVVDQSLIPGIPGVLLAEGRFDTSVSIITGHTAADGLLFTDPFISTSSDYTTYLQSVFPNMNASTLAYINDTLYPALYDGSQAYTTPFGRTNATMGEVTILCNTLFLQDAYRGKSWASDYVVPPAVHASDLYPIFYPHQLPGVAVNATLATIMQTYFTTFAEKGNPNSAGVPYWPLAGNGVVLNLGDDGVLPAGDIVPAARCAWWQKALYA